MRSVARNMKRFVTSIYVTVIKTIVILKLTRAIFIPFAELHGPIKIPPFN